MEEEMTIIQNQNIETMKSIIYGGIFGLVVGDALGVPHEFKSRSLFDKNPVTGMDSYGTYNQPAGTWSDDSSLTLATLDSLSKGLDYYDMMDKFTSWYTEDKYTPFDKVFDIGNATLNAILNYISSKDTMLSGLTDSAKVHMAYATKFYSDKPICIITYNEMQAKKIMKDMEFFSDKVDFFPKRGPSAPASTPLIPI